MVWISISVVTFSTRGEARSLHESAVVVAVVVAVAVAVVAAVVGAVVGDKRGSRWCGSWTMHGVLVGWVSEGAWY